MSLSEGLILELGKSKRKSQVVVQLTMRWVEEEAVYLAAGTEKSKAALEPWLLLWLWSWL